MIVGSNSSGKSQLLRDIQKKLSGEPRELVVATHVGIRQLPHEPLLEYLRDQGYISVYEDTDGNVIIRPKRTYAGMGGAPQIQKSQLDTWHNAYKNPNATYSRRPSEYLGYLGRFLLTALFLDQRLTALNQTALIDFQNSPPAHDLHVLFLNDQAKEQLLEEIKTSFSKQAWPDISQGNNICLRVSDNPEVPSAVDRSSATKMASYRTIETEGDGLKSYVATCIALLLGRRPVCLIDEPEMCLHPPQAFNLGDFIGRFGTSTEEATFVATHSSQILRGVIQTGAKLQIIRLTKLAGQFHAHLVSSDALKLALAKPTVRAESVLDGIFAQAVVVLEADGDRTVYHAVWETLENEFHLDIHFAAVNGTSGIADTCALYTTLQIPVVALADIDVIADAEMLRRILNSLGSTETESLVSESQQVISAIMKLPPSLSPEDARKEILDALTSDLDWNKNDDSVLRGKLRKIANQLDRMRRIKRKTSSEPLPEETQRALENIIQKLLQAGLFVVPVGELEGWLADKGIQASRENKWAWANEAAVLVRKVGSNSGDIWEFMRSIGKHLRQMLDSTNGLSH
ncbi:MAG TPA: TOPRIM nucleotidyl transferase/hydrolase domain-containing protein [Methylophilaceae bacterium]